MKKDKKMLNVQKLIKFFGIKLIRARRWYDIPPIFEYTASKNSCSGTGSSIENRFMAIKKAVFEFAELYSLTHFNKRNFVKSEYREVKNVIPFQDLYLPFLNRKKYVISEKDKFYFTKGFDLLRNKKIFIPSQLIYLYFPENFGEKVIREPNSNGSSARPSLKEALIHGILEVIERDAFFIYYLNNSLGQLLKIDSAVNEKLADLLRMLKNYKFETYLFYLPTDFRVLNICALIIDKSGVGPMVSVGSSSGFDLEKLISKALVEALQVMGWSRNIVAFEQNKILYNKRFNNVLIKNVETRAFYWYFLNKLHIIYDLINNSKKIFQKPVYFSKLNKEFKKISLQFTSPKYMLSYLLESAVKLSKDIYFSETTHFRLRKYGIRSVKIVMPKLQPIYLNEDYRQINFSRVCNLLFELGITNNPSSYSQINKVPHFFL